MGLVSLSPEASAAAVHTARFRRINFNQREIGSKLQLETFRPSREVFSFKILAMIVVHSWVGFLLTLPDLHKKLMANGKSWSPLF
jgi:hypothetical protein